MYEITIKNGSNASVLHDGKNIFASAGNFTEEVNCIPSANIDILRNNPCWDLLHDRKTVVEIKNIIADEIEFEGTLLRSTAKMSTSGQVVKSLICEGFLGYLCDSIQPYHHYENTTAEAFVEALLSVHNSMMPEEKRIYLGSCDITGDNTNSKTTAYRNTLEEIKVNLLDRIGGEIRIRKVDGRLVLDLLTQYGTQTNTTIELAKNIRSLEVSSDPANIITRLIPLGTQLDASASAERLTIAEVNGGKLYIDDENAIAKYGIIAGTAVFDNITNPANLKTAGMDYLINNNRVKKSYSANVLDLSVLDPSEQSIRAGNTYRFRNSFIGLDEDLRLMKRKVNIFEPYAPEVEIGDKAEKMTDIAVRTAQLIEYEMPKQKLDILSSAKETATALIDAGINGYCVINKNEILIMDSPDKENAVHVWRWNSGGFGYSSTGYHGTYGTAITMDGAIVADFITAGVLRGLEIINGDGTFHVLPDGTVQASAIDITGGRIHMTTNSENYDAIYLNYRDISSYLAPVGFASRNTASKRRTDVRADGIRMYPNYDDMQTYSIAIYSSNGNITTNGTITATGNITTSGTITATGNISTGGTVTAGTLTAEAITFKLNGTNSGLEATINGINNYIDAEARILNGALDSIRDLDRRVSALEGN